MALACAWLLLALLPILGASAETAGGPSRSSAAPGRVLVTGFGPFHHHGHEYDHNPSGEVAELLDGQCFQDTICVEGMKLPVDDAGVQVAQNFLLQGNPKAWEAIIHLGLESTTKGLKVEVAALNNKAKDNSTIIDGGSTILPTTVDLGALDLAPALSGVDGSSPEEMWSRDAGHFYCNEIFYRTLRVVRRMYMKDGRLMPVVFVHLPPTEGVNALRDIARVVLELSVLITKDSPPSS